MTTLNEIKLKTLFKELKPGQIVTASWLEGLGISRDLQKHYLKSKWLEPVGRGAYKKPGDKVEWISAIKAIQTQNQVKTHVGALSALSLLGYGHYFRLKKETLFLLSPLRTILPKWFLDHSWDVKIFHKNTSVFPPELSLMYHLYNQTEFIVSSPERAIMECLLLAPKEIDLVECYQIMEGLVNLKPKLINELLCSCNSVIVKRLFLYMAEKANHQWFQFLNLDKIDLGNGNRMVVSKGVYISKYLISIPKELAEL